MVHLGPRTSAEYQPARAALRTIRVRVGAIASDLERQHPLWVTTKDARRTYFSRLANDIESAELALKFLDESLAHTDWWAANYGPLPSPRDTGIYIVEFSQFTKTALLQLAFGTVESACRVFLRAVDAGACEGGTREFKSIYECLLRTKLQLAEADDRVALLDVLRELRNTIHNHGVYFHRSNRGIVTAWRLEAPLLAAWRREAAGSLRSPTAIVMARRSRAPRR